MNNPAKIIIVINHSLFRKGMKELIEEEGMGNVIAEGENGLELLDLLKIHTPDLVLMDIEMPLMDGLEATIKSKSMIPDLKILVLTMLNLKDKCTEMINAGALGFVLKTSGKPELEKAIQTVMNGEKYFTNNLLGKIILNIDKYKPASENTSLLMNKFTNREIEILQYYCKGFEANEIADKLFRSIKTIRTYRSKLLQKTNSKNTINLILYAIKNKLVDINS